MENKTKIISLVFGMCVSLVAAFYWIFETRATANEAKRSAETAIAKLEAREGDLSTIKVQGQQIQSLQNDVSKMDRKLDRILEIQISVIERDSKKGSR